MTTEPKFVLKALQGKTVIVTEDSIRIEKEGGFFAVKRDKTIPIRQITSVEVKQPSRVVGFIQFSIAGGKTYNSSFTVTGGAYEAVADENAATFLSDECYNIALEIKQHIESWSQPGEIKVNSPSPADELVKYADLLERGLLTREEFDEKKKHLMRL
jgi:hypothetical protein